MSGVSEGIVCGIVTKISYTHTDQKQKIFWETPGFYDLFLHLIFIINTEDIINMTSTKEKIVDLDLRIENINKQIDELEQTKINLIMLKRDFSFNETKKVLEDAFEETMKSLPPDKQQEMYKKFEDFS